MRLGWWCAVIVAFVAACSSKSSQKTIHDGAGGNAGSGGASGSNAGGDDSGGSSSKGGSVGKGSGGTASSGGDAGSGTGGAVGGDSGTGGDGGTASAVDRRWAQWPVPSPASYDTSVADVVTDNVTGLMWQRTLSIASVVWSEASSYCEDLSLAGHSDWRLPTRIELVSLIDVTRSNPSIDPVAFPNTPSALFWTSSPMAGDPGLAWSVYFGYGGTGQSPVDLTGVRVRCVR